MDFPGQNFTGYGSGTGGELGLGYALDDHWSFWLTGDVYFLQQSYDDYGYFYDSYNVNLFSLAFTARYAFGEGPFQPYVGAGAGLKMENYLDSADHMLQGVLGMGYKLDKTWSVFLEAKGNFIFQPLDEYYYGYYSSASPAEATGIDIPINAGMILDFSGAGEPESTAAKAERDVNFFLRTGVGESVITNQYEPYDGSTGNYFPTLSTSIAAGFDFPNQFSFFTSLQRTPGDWAVLANLQYSLWTPLGFEPYLYLGAGVDFPADPPLSFMNNASQAAIGVNIDFSPSTDLYFELKAYNASNFHYFTSPYGGDAVGIFETGFKYNLSKPSSPVAPAPGNYFVEMAGGLDLPARNWQPAYSLGSGGMFGAGYEFNDGLAFLLDVEDFDYSGTNYQGSIGDHELLFLPTVRYPLLPKGIRPYLTAGAGLDVEVSWTQYNNNAQVAYFDMALGAGLEVPFDPLNSAFVEGKYNFTFAYDTLGQDLPLLAGIRLGFN